MLIMLRRCRESVWRLKRKLTPHLDAVRDLPRMATRRPADRIGSNRMCCECVTDVRQCSEPVQPNHGESERPQSQGPSSGHARR